MYNRIMKRDIFKTIDVKEQAGFGIVEVLVVAVIISLVLVGLHATTVQALRLVQQSTKRTQATFLAEETIEVLRAMRDTGWTSSIGTLSASTDYFLAFNGSAWTISTTNIFIDDLFERKFVIENVNRDANDDIATSGTMDPNTKKITATVSWLSQTGTTTQSVNTYITNLFQN